MMIIGSRTNFIISNFYKITIRTYSTLKLSLKSEHNMEKAYFRHSIGDDLYHLNFVFVDESKGVHRQFNFSRRCDENVGSLINRINTNVEKVMMKKTKKGKSKNSLTPEENVNDKIVTKLIQDGKVISEDTACLEVMKSNAKIELQVIENKYHVLVNAPWISNMALPSSILAGFLLYPTKLEGDFFEKDMCQFTWYRSEGKNPNPSQLNWEKVGDGFSYMTSSIDIGKKIKFTCIPGNKDSIGPETECISTNNVEAGPGYCPFETRHLFTKDKCSGKLIRVISYNILADLYCDSDVARTELFPYCPSYALEIDYRKQLFSKEIIGYNGDIVCLQEVDSKIFNFDLKPLLAANSYEGCFTKKGGQVTEGLACFYRKDRFKLIDQKSCILGEELKSLVFEDIWNMIKNNEAFVNRIEPRTTAVQATVLQSLDNDNEIVVVGNTHFYFHPDADHVRVVQGGLTITWLHSILNFYKETVPNKRISLILCGDFNSVPSCGVYQLYTTGIVPSDIPDWKSNEAEALSDVTFKQPTLLASACGTPEYTNFTVGFADCLDYIFYNIDSFDVNQIVPLPSNEELKQHAAIPSVVFPSDHVALVADLKFK